MSFGRFVRIRLVSLSLLGWAISLVGHVRLVLFSRALFPLVFVFFGASFCLHGVFWNLFCTDWPEFYRGLRSDFTERCVALFYCFVRVLRPSRSRATICTLSLPNGGRQYVVFLWALCLERASWYYVALASLCRSESAAGRGRES